VSKKQEDIIEYGRPNNGRLSDPDTLVLDGETPAKQHSPLDKAFNWRDHKHFIVVQHQPAIAAYEMATAVFASVRKTYGEMAGMQPSTSLPNTPRRSPTRSWLSQRGPNDRGRTVIR
jgi:hypothetical protein